MQLALEVFVVVLGVTLALGANELRRHFLDERKVGVAMESITAELQQNCDRLSRTEAYHERVLAEFDSLRAARSSAVEGDARAVIRALPSWRGYDPASVTSTAYETALSTGTLELMPYDVVLGLGDYYTSVAAYQETVRQAFNTVIQAGEPTVAQLEIALRITSEQQRQLAPQSCVGARELRGEAADL